jgi:predicted transcriptional regulator
MEMYARARLLKVKEVASILNISPSAVYGYVRRKLLKEIRMPLVRPSRAKIRNKQTLRITEEAVKEFVNKLLIRGE